MIHRNTSKQGGTVHVGTSSSRSGSRKKERLRLGLGYGRRPASEQQQQKDQQSQSQQRQQNRGREGAALAETVRGRSGSISSSQEVVTRWLARGAKLAGGEAVGGGDSGELDRSRMINIHEQSRRYTP
ncbi:hypothetical protein AXG93_1962s1780 [Marchantia polymorpha subsp. ruderalis]|uniref:Uncharacterized protein n=1 Tax=Marchantia polymorpha subsp. ruderalis TaxID=1480154 RepID=A0A176WFD9_MARPO|nr:hypothetical protein AXG93_1962s1780 [Marchantia polymorpha subsp. ruderalis]